jgi:hypothetical protein
MLLETFGWRTARGEIPSGPMHPGRCSLVLAVKRLMLVTVSGCMALFTLLPAVFPYLAIAFLVLNVAGSFRKT